MLKALVQLFAEKFLQSKKQWVSGQAFPESRIELSSTTRGYVAPADGYFCIFHSGGSGGNMLFDLDARTATGTPPSIVVSEIVGCFIATLSWAPLSLLKKGCQSILRPIQSQSRFGSVRQRVGVNLSTGGSLC